MTGIARNGSIDGKEASFIGGFLDQPTGVSDRLSITEEFYTFQDNPRSRVDVLLHLDPASVGATGDYPLAWAHSVGAGRAYYNALGHFPETWRDARFQRMLTSAVAWTAGR